MWYNIILLWVVTLGTAERERERESCAGIPDVQILNLKILIITVL